MGASAGPSRTILPGLRHGLDEGLVKSYYATIQNYRANTSGEYDLSEEVGNRLHSFYSRSIDQLDPQLLELLSFVAEDAITILTADPGEEFHHGVVGHARLYDESDRVPLIWKPSLDGVSESPVRHNDIAPTLLKQTNISIPEFWSGEPHTGEHQPAYMVTFAPAVGHSYAAIRDDHKLIWTFDYETRERLSEEFYPLSIDPYETRSLMGHSEVDVYREFLREFVEREPIPTFSATLKTGDINSPESHLRELGYLK